MKYRLGSVTIEAIDAYVRVSVGDRAMCTKRQCPKSTDVAALLMSMQDYAPNQAQLQACGRGADDARANKRAAELIL